VVAVEVTTPKGFGRCRMQIIPNASGKTLHGFISDTIAPGATVVTDGWNGYLGIDTLGYHHDRRSQRAARARGEDIDGPASRRAPDRVVGQTMAAVHPSRRRRSRSPARISRRVLFPVQPAPIE